jgi:hypothetical protein
MRIACSLPRWDAGNGDKVGSDAVRQVLVLAKSRFLDFAK